MTGSRELDVCFYWPKSYARANQDTTLLVVIPFHKSMCIYFVKIYFNIINLIIVKSKLYLLERNSSLVLKRDET
jgi:hypothetical protein